MERQFKGIWFPSEIWHNKELSWNEKILLLEIDSFTTSERDCFISDEYIAELLGVKENTANKILSSLIKKGYVIKTGFDGRYRHIKSALHFCASQPCILMQPCLAFECNPNNNNIQNNILLKPNNNNKSTIKENTKRKSTNTEEDEDLYNKFVEFAKLYKSLTKKAIRSFKTEFDDFKKRHNDWRDVIPYLSMAITRETKARNEAKGKKEFFPEPKLLQTYLGKQRAWELYVKVGEDLSCMDNEYIPEQSFDLRWNDLFGCYVYIGGFYDKTIPDGYNDENRPNGATIMLNNARGTIKWNSQTKTWDKI